MTPPTKPDRDPSQTTGKEAAPNQPDGSAIEELNRQTLPRTPDGQVVDPKQEEAKDSAG
jgi:hypothetical protein